MRVAIRKGLTGWEAVAKGTDRRDKSVYAVVQLGELTPMFDKAKFSGLIAQCMSEGAENFIQRSGVHRYTSNGEG